MHAVYHLLQCDSVIFLRFCCKRSAFAGQGVHLGPEQDARFPHVRTLTAKDNRTSSSQARGVNVTNRNGPITGRLSRGLTQRSRPPRRVVPSN